MLEQLDLLGAAVQSLTNIATDSIQDTQQVQSQQLSLSFVDSLAVKGSASPIPFEWESRIKYPLLDKDLRILKLRIANGLPKTVQDALTSEEWKPLLGRKPKERSELVKDMCALIFHLVNPINVLNYYGDPHQSSSTNPDTTTSTSSYQVRSSCNQEGHTKEDEKHYTHCGEDSGKKKGKKGKPFNRETLLEMGYSEWHLSCLRPYYRNRETLALIENILKTPYIVPGHTKQQCIIHIVPHNKKWYIKFDSFLTQQERGWQFIEREGFVAGHKREVRLKWEFMIGTPLLLKEYINWTELDFPERVSVVECCRSLIGKRHKEKTITDQGITPKSSSWKIRMEQAELFCWIEDWIKNVDDFGFDHGTPVRRSWQKDRHYSAYGRLPSEIRKLYTWKRKPLIWIDVSSCHQILIMQKYYAVATPEERVIIEKIINAPMNLSDEERHPRKRLADMAGKPCDDAFKTALLSWYNCPSWQMIWQMNGETGEISSYSDKSIITQAYYRVGLTGFVKWLSDWKTQRRCKDSHKVVSAWLLKEESRIMDYALATCFDRGIFALGVHDGIDCDPAKVVEVRSIIMDSFAMHGYPCALKDDRGEDK